MQRPLFIIASALLLISCASRTYEQNPDPNHTHADFAVFMDGVKFDFSGEKFMSESESEEADDDHEAHGHKHHPYFHLHDGVGHVLHMHKPGLPLREFFDSIAFRFNGPKWRMFVNGEETTFDLGYVFKDMDTILFTDSSDDEAVRTQLEEMTDDACLYSKTCPWRGKPPIENCIADPAVPCVIPE